jgi:beta-glucanase (GH16 family)
MRLTVISTLSILLAMACNSPEQKPVAPSMKLVWSDEFNYNGLPDSTRWNYDTGGHGGGNNELQYYTGHRPENARVENGHLVIEAHREKWENRDYTSARLISKGKGDWKYGRIEVRARLPRGTGTWPAIWMLASTNPLAWPDDGEIDIMEHVGFAHGRIHGTVHTKKYNHVAGTQRGDTIRINDCADNFHIYSVEWEADSLRIAVDSSVYFRFNNERSGYEAWPFDKPFHLLLNIAVGGNWGGQKGVDTTIWPQRMEVDYVRVYQKK